MLVIHRKRTVKQTVLSVFGHLLVCVPMLAQTTPPGVTDSLNGSDHVRTLDHAILPIISYSQETRWILGGAVFFTLTNPDSTATAWPSVILPALMYSQNRQFTASLEFDHYWDDGARRTFGALLYMKFPDQFYGIGNDLTDEFETYTPKTVAGHIYYQQLFSNSFNLAVGLEAENVKIVESEPGSLIDTKSIPGATGGQQTGLGFQVVWDTRDHNQYPMSGSHITTGWTRFLKLVGSDFDYTSLSLDARYYVSLSTSQVLAFQLDIRDISGPVPFYSMSTLGGPNSMRGYFTGRYRHNDKVVLQSEYRLVLPKRWGLSLFASLGEVHESFGRMRSDEFKSSVGFGFRYLVIPDSKAYLRFDFGFGKNTSGMSVAFTEAF